jgi:RNAse (barnase) inhibitor barstar
MKKVKKYTINFTEVNYYLEMHAVIWDALEFPDYYGCNWSAFWDCLTDMYGDPIHIEIIGLDVIERKFGSDTTQKMLEILKRFKHFNNDLFSDDIKIELVSGDTRISIQ